MNYSSDFSTSEEYLSFRSTVPLRKIAVESADTTKLWKVYAAGPDSVKSPLIFLGPVSGTADVFYKQILNLTAHGIRVLSVEGPVYWTVDDWCEGFKKLLDFLGYNRVHLFGASLGGFLAQKFCEYTHQFPRVASVILCNTFLDTSIFNYNETAAFFWLMPSFVLKKLVLGNLLTEKLDLSIAQAVDFMNERLDSLSQQELASRLTINCTNCNVDSFKLKDLKITIMDVFNDSALSAQARNDLYASYSDAKFAHLKCGGNFPYLSRSDEVNMHVLIHLRQFKNTRVDAGFSDTQLTENQSKNKNITGMKK